jgi:hypothetical protein
MVDELASPDTLQQQQPSQLDLLFHAIHGQESGGGANTATSPTGAIGDMQIEPGTFKQFALPGEQITNRDDNIRVGKRILSTYLKQYNGDASRAAVAYFSGPGNVSPPGSPQPFIHDFSDGAKTVSSYVSDIGRRMGDPNVRIAALRSSQQNGQQNQYDMSSLTQRQPPSFLDTVSNVVTDTAEKKAEAAPAPATAEQKPSQLGQGGVFGLAPQQPPPAQAPRTMDYYLALLKQQPTPGSANG